VVGVGLDRRVTCDSGCGRDRARQGGELAVALVVALSENWAYGAGTELWHPAHLLAVGDGASRTMLVEAAIMSKTYTHSTWRVKPGLEDEFVRR